MVPANGQWCLAAGKVTVGLASHWPCVTDISGSPRRGSRPRRGRWAPANALLVEYGELCLFYHYTTEPHIGGVGRIQCISFTWWFTSEFNVTDCVTQGLGHDYRGRTLIAHGSSFGRMILLPAPVTSAEHEPRLAGFKSVAFTAWSRLFLKTLHHITFH